MKPLLLLLLSAVGLLGQNAAISGLIKDPSGAIIPNAAVTVANQDTGAERVTSTNAEGLYSVAALNPGRYKISVSCSGFETAMRQDVVLDVAQNARFDFVLKVGRSGQSVTVTADTSQINTVDGSVGTTIGPEMIENLPLNGRSFQDLFTLTPGVSLAPAGSDGQFIVNGQRASANYVTVDGVSANTGVFGSGIGAGSAVAGGSAFAANAAGGTNSLVSVDALQEFRILTSSFSPEYGRTPGGQVILLTKSGTNVFHGNLFEYFRNDRLDATNWFVNQQGQAKPALRVNNFGGTLGGPVIRNKTFFFFSYEGERLRQPSFAVSSVPSIASRQGAPAASAGILKAFPIPNGPSLGNNQAQFAAGFSNPITTDATSIKIDHVFRSNFTAFGRYSYAPSASTVRPGGALALSVMQSHPSNTETLTLGGTYIITSRMVNEARVNLTDTRFSQINNLDNFGGAQALPATVFPAPLSPLTGVTEINLNYTGGQIWYGRSVGNEQRQINPVDNVSYTLGSHQFKFGIDYRRLLPISPAQNGLLYNFAGIPGVAADMLTSFTLGYEGRVIGDLTNFSGFFQDNWRIAARLTLTYGVRWDVNTAPRDRDANNGNYVPLLGNYTDPSTIHLGTPGSPLWNTQYLNFAPRLGVAYQLNRTAGWETVLRGGAGLFYDLGNGNAAFNPWVDGFPNNQNVILQKVAFPLSPGQVTRPPYNLASPPNTQAFFAYPSDSKLPRTWQWNVSLQQAIARDQSLTVSYVAALGRDLVYPQLYDNLTPKNFHLTYTTNAGSSDYQAMQVQFQRRLRHGLSATAAYTWSHSLDSNSADNATVVPTSFQGALSNKGNSDFDLRQTFSSAFTWNAPGASTKSWLRPLTRDWGLDGVIMARSALPLNVTSARDIGFGSFALRPDLAPGVPVWVSNPDVAGGEELNKAAFIVPVSNQGGLGRNTLRGFGMYQADISARRTFRLAERYRLLFRADLFNLLNHPNFANPVGDLGSGLFGQSTAMLNGSIGGGATFGLNSLFQAGGPRSVQLSLKLQF